MNHNHNFYQGRSDISFLDHNDMAWGDICCFMSRSGNSIIDSNLWLLVILAVMALFGYRYHSLTQKENDVFEKWTKGTVWYNRALNFTDMSYITAQEELWMFGSMVRRSLLTER